MEEVFFYLANWNLNLFECFPCGKNDISLVPLEVLKYNEGKG